MIPSPSPPSPEPPGRVTPSMLIARADELKATQDKCATEIAAADVEDGVEAPPFTCPTCEEHRGIEELLRAAALQIETLTTRAEQAESERNGLATFNPDWDMLRATQDSLREHMATIRDLRLQVETLTQENARLADLARRVEAFKAELSPPYLFLLNAALATEEPTR